MSLFDSIAIQKYHRDRIIKFGADSSQSLGWLTPAGQEARFKALVEMLGDLTNKSVLDAGCGHGDLRGYLGEKFSGLRYAGIDQVDTFLDVAVARYGHYPETSFYFGDFIAADVPVMDYAIACGALSYRNSDPDFVFKAITKLFNSCRLGLAFNLLRSIENAEGILVGYDPEIILAHCRTLSTDVKFTGGYHGEDYTVGMTRK